MDKTNKKNLWIFFTLTYVVFYILLAITGVMLALENVSPTMIVIMKNICAWSSTFVLLILFRKLFPNISFKTFLKQQFSRVNVFDFVLCLILQFAIIIGVISVFLFINQRSFESLSFIHIADLLPILLINITSGPLGEELGWRGYALNEFQKKYTPLASSVLIGLIWGFWHLPLWLLSGYSGTNLLIYIIFFLVGIISVSVLITYFYNKSKNILIAVWIHFWFNFLLQIVMIDLLPLLTYASIFYLISTGIIVFFNRKTMMQKPHRAIA